VENTDEVPRTLKGMETRSDKVEAVLNEELPQWDVLMSKEFKPPE
jgi:hypothetical protein